MRVWVNYHKKTTKTNSDFSGFIKSDSCHNKNVWLCSFRGVRLQTF